MALPRIFLAIAAYRDPETAATVVDAFDQADAPERLRVGICWQHVPGEDDHHFTLPLPEGATRVVHVHAGESRGAGWARSIAHGLREDEEYVLQVDSHMRFHAGWDSRLMAQLEACGTPRAALSAYPAAYEPPCELGPCGAYRNAPAAFDKAGILSFEGRPIVAPAPVRTAWIAGGFLFAPAALFDEVPYDPQVYFLGEEVSLSARAWTHGWDLFAPTECVVHHFYGRASEVRHWQDHRDWGPANRVSLVRVRHLLGIEATREPGLREGLDGIYGLGTARSLEDFQRFARVDFARRRIG